MPPLEKKSLALSNTEPPRWMQMTASQTVQTSASSRRRRASTNTLLIAFLFPSILPSTGQRESKNEFPDMGESRRAAEKGKWHCRLDSIETRNVICPISTLRWRLVVVVAAPHSVRLSLAEASRRSMTLCTNRQYAAPNNSRAK